MEQQCNRTHLILGGATIFYVHWDAPNIVRFLVYFHKASILKKKKWLLQFASLSNKGTSNFCVLT